MRTIYTSGPITAPTLRDRRKNIAVARRYAKKLWHIGFGVLCPHLNDGGMELEGTPYETLMEFDLKMCELLDCIFMLPRWKRSPGAKRELKRALAHNKIAFYSLKDAKEWIEKNND